LPLVAANDNFPARLLTKSQAASYCGLSLPTFSSVCPVRPIALGVGVRMECYDVREIDGWIDGLQNAGKPFRTGDAPFTRTTVPVIAPQAVASILKTRFSCHVQLFLRGGLIPAAARRACLYGYRFPHLLSMRWPPSRSIPPPPSRCANSYGKPWTVSGFRASWRPIRQKLEKEGKVQPGLTLKGLRHTVATILREMGKDYSTIAEMLGQKTEAMSKHYSRRADTSKKMAQTVTEFEAEVNRQKTKDV